MKIKLKYKLPNINYSARKLKVFVNQQRNTFMFPDDEICLDVEVGDKLIFKLDDNKTFLVVDEFPEYLVIYFDYRSQIPLVRGVNSMIKNCLTHKIVTEEEFEAFTFPEPKKVKFSKPISVFGILSFITTGVFAVIEYNKDQDSLLAILLFLMSLNGVIFYLENFFSKFILQKGAKARNTVMAIASALAIALLPFSLLVKLMMLVLISSAYVFSSKELANSD